jgi:2-oxoglutarate dehydrogenase E1 component
MAHRGRLNALHCVLKVHAQDLFKEFLEKSAEGDTPAFAGDVKYHLGKTTKREINGKEISLTMLSNPSHLEAVNPCVYGSTRAIQEVKNDKNK